jgi:ATP-dependent RNA helicase RhlE
MSVSLFDVQEAALPVRDDLKPALLAELLRRFEGASVVVFVRTKNRADRLAQWLKDQGFNADRVHGNRSPAQRLRAVGEFRSGGLQVLVVTDLGGKVDELPKLGALVHFDVPGAEDYLNRLELTYGSEEEGAAPAAYTLVGDLEIREIKGVERVLGRTLPPRSLEDFDYDVIEVEELFEPLGAPVPMISAQPRSHQAQPVSKNKRRKGRRRPDAPRPAGHSPSFAGHGNHASSNNGQGGPSPERIERLIAAAAEMSGPRALARRPGDRPGATHVPAAFRNVGKVVP